MESAAFENFKFKVGDLVVHVSDEKHLAQRGVVIARALIEGVAGVERQYQVSFRTVDVCVCEIELALYEQPIRV